VAVIGRARGLHASLAPSFFRARSLSQPSLRALKNTHPAPLSPLPFSVSSAFSHLLNLHNLSEEISTAMHERAVRVGDVSLK